MLQQQLMYYLSPLGYTSLTIQLVCISLGTAYAINNHFKSKKVNHIKFKEFVKAGV